MGYEDDEDDEVVSVKRGFPKLKAGATSLGSATRPNFKDAPSQSFHRSSRTSTSETSKTSKDTMQADENAKEEKLKAAIWYSVGQTIDSVALSQDLNATPHFIGGLSEMVWGQIENVARDLEAFSKHSGRSTINTKDVLLLGRRNEGLESFLRSQAKTVQQKERATGGDR